MSEHFTHIAVYEDSVRLLLSDPELCPAFRNSLVNQYDSGLLGSGSRGNHIFAVPIFEKYKDVYDGLPDKTEAETKIAYAIGWLTHRASDLQMKPIFRRAEADPDPRFTNQISSIYHDCMSFRKIYSNGSTPSLSSNEILSPATFAYNMVTHPAANNIDIATAEPLFNRMWQKDLMKRVTFVSQEKDVAKWFDNFVQKFPKFSEDFREYEKAFNDPDTALIERHWVQDKLYFDSDDIIQYVRNIQNSQKPSMELQEVVESDNNKSEYAKAIRNGYKFVKASNDFFVGRATKTQAYDAAKIEESSRR